MAPRLDLLTLPAVFFKTVRARLFDRAIREVPSQKIEDLALRKPIDLMFFFVFPRVGWATNQFLRRCRANFSPKEWPSLSLIYARPAMWFYIYLLYAWAKYCNIVEQVTANPDRSRLAEAFLRYICDMDSFLDGFDSRLYLSQNPRAPQRLPKVRQTGRVLLDRLGELDVDESTKRAALKLIVRYRRNALEGLVEAAQNSDACLEQTLRDKELVAGELWRTWSLLLGCLYGVPPAMAQNAAGAFFNGGMALQIIDDLSDAADDLEVGAQNMTLAAIRQTPNEQAVFSNYLKMENPKVIYWPWTRRHLPVTYDRLTGLYDSYAARIGVDSLNPAVAQEFYNQLKKLITWTERSGPKVK